MLQHDSTLTALLTLLGVFDNVVPPYSSAVMLELYKKDNDYTVKLIYRNNTFTNDTFELPLTSKLEQQCCIKQ